MLSFLRRWPVSPAICSNNSGLIFSIILLLVAIYLGSMKILWFSSLSFLSWIYLWRSIIYCFFCKDYAASLSWMSAICRTWPTVNLLFLPTVPLIFLYSSWCRVSLAFIYLYLCLKISFYMSMSCIIALVLSNLSLDHLFILALSLAPMAVASWLICYVLCISNLAWVIYYG